MYSKIRGPPNQKGIINLLERGLSYLKKPTNNRSNDELYQIIFDYALNRSQENFMDFQYLCDFFNVPNHQYHGLTKEYINEFLDCLVQKQISPELGNKSQNNLITYTSELDPSSLESKKWLSLYHVCIRSGFLRVAYHVREKAINSAFLSVKNKKSFETLSLAFRGKLDNSDFDGAWDYLCELKKIFYRYQVISEFEPYYYLKRGDLKSFQKIKKRYLSPHDIHFQKMIEGKHIAIVGPAPSGEQLGNEIDSFDIVIRIGYRGREFLPDKFEFGKKINISYYGDFFSSKMLEVDNSFLKDLDFMVFKTKKYDYQMDFIQNRKARTFKRDTSLFNGSPFETNNIIFDLLHFNPEFVKLFKVNFYLSKMSHYVGYSFSSGFNGTASRNLKGLAHHDILSNLNFTRNINKNGLIEVDRACSRVLDLHNYDYCSCMEKIIDDE